jgi:hypothetical protein
MKKNLWIIVGRIGIGLMLVIIPLQAQAASMLVDLVSSGTADGGTVLSKTRYGSTVVGEENIRENQYSTSIMGAHSEVGTMDQHFANSSDSDISGAGLTIQVGQSSNPNNIFPGVFNAEEKIGTGIIQGSTSGDVATLGGFQGAMGSEISLYEGTHLTEGATNEGEVGYTIDSEGLGRIKVSAVSSFQEYEAPIETEPGLTDLLHLCTLFGANDAEDMTETASQDFSFGYQSMRGNYTYNFGGTLGPPTSFLPPSSP